MARNSEEASAILQAKGFTTIPVRGDIILATRALPQSSLEKTEAIILVIHTSHFISHEKQYH
jgi:hypothetical protein